jgi:hypothetical protein
MMITAIPVVTGAGLLPEILIVAPTGTASSCTFEIV